MKMICFEDKYKHNITLANQVVLEDLKLILLSEVIT
jgi:hypothetical protein